MAYRSGIIPLNSALQVLEKKYLLEKVLTLFQLGRDNWPADIWSGKIVSFHIIYVVSCMPNLWLVLRPCLYLILVVAQWIKQRPYVGHFICTFPSWVSRENTLWYTTAFSSNSSSLRPVFSTITELLSTSFTELMSTTEFSSTSELSSN